MNDHLDGFEPGLCDAIEGEARAFEFDGLSVLSGPLVWTGIEEAGSRVAQEHLHVTGAEYADTQCDREWVCCPFVSGKSGFPLGPAPDLN